MQFIYSANGALLGLKYNGADYYYIRNEQGDIIGILDSQGITVVGYYYDAWGRLLSTEGPMGDTLGYDNPFRYRGYYYDNEMGYYYLQSRYYSPSWGRFINMDSIIAGGANAMNAFAYCEGNPVNLSDPAGMASSFSWWTPALAAKSSSFSWWTPALAAKAVSATSTTSSTAKPASTSSSSVPYAVWSSYFVLQAQTTQTKKSSSTKPNSSHVEILPGICVPRIITSPITRSVNNNQAAKIAQFCKDIVDNVGADLGAVDAIIAYGAALDLGGALTLHLIFKSNQFSQKFRYGNIYNSITNNLADQNVVGYDFIISQDPHSITVREYADTNISINPIIYIR